jgi:hypothetical protein
LRGFSDARNGWRHDGQVALDGPRPPTITRLDAGWAVSNARGGGEQQRGVKGRFPSANFQFLKRGRIVTVMATAKPKTPPKKKAAAKAKPKNKRCGQPKDGGGKCGAWRVKGEEACMGHLDRKKKEALGFGGPQPGSGRPRNPKPSELNRRLMEENQLAVMRPYWRALGFDVVIGDDGPELVALPEGGAKVVSRHKGVAFTSNIEDLGAQMEASEKLQDRTFGKPSQSVEINGGEKPVRISNELLGNKELREALRGAARGLADARAGKPGRAGPGD